MAMRAILMSGLAISAIALAITPAEAKKARHHKAVDTQAAQTRELNLAQLTSLQQAKAQQSAAAQPSGAQPAPPAQSASAEGSAPEAAPAPAPGSKGEDKQADNGKLPDLQGASDEVKADQARSNTAMQTPAPATAPGRAIALGEVANPKQTLAKAAIETKDGQKVGEVAQVETDANGKANAVTMTAQGSQTVRIDASKLTFMPDRGVLVTELTQAEIGKPKPK
jgi:uncharacterized protein involved in copper resistance